MTAITEKITTALQPLSYFEDATEFGELCKLVRNDLLGFQQNIPLKKMSKRFGLDPLEI